MSEKESDIASLFANELAESLANTIKGRGFRSGMIARNKAKGKAVWVGYETDLLKSAAQYVSGLSAGIAKRDMAAKMVKAFSGTDIDRKDYASDEEYMKEVERRRIDPTEQRNAFHDVTKFMEHVLRNEEFADRVIGAIKGAVVLKYIAGRLASPLINLTALVTSVPAAMHGYGDIPFAPGLRSLGRAMADYRVWRWGDASTLNPDTKWIMDQIHERGWHNAQYNREALAVIRSKFGGAWSKTIDLLMMPFGATEQLNRISTIAGTYRALRQKKISREEALVTAKKVSDRAHGTYGKTTRPYLAQGKGPVAQAAQAFYVFSKFSHNYMQTMYDLGFRKKDRRALSWMMVSPILIAGGAAMPILGPILMQVLGAITALWEPDRPEEGEERFYRYVLDHLGPRAETMARFGLAGLAGLNIKGSITIDPVSGIPTTLPEALGAPGSFLNDIYLGGKSVLRGDIYRGVEKLAPRFIGTPMQSFREQAHGVTTRGNIPLVLDDQPIMPTTADMVLRILSFNPAHLAELKERKWNEGTLVRKYQEKRGEIYDRLRGYYQQGPQRRRELDLYEILADIDQYNRTIGSRKLFAVKGLGPITKRSIESAMKTTR